MSKRSKKNDADRQASDPATDPAAAAGAGQNQQFGRQVLPGDEEPGNRAALDRQEERDRRTQAANPGRTVPQDQAGHPAPQSDRDVDAAANPHNRQEIPGVEAGHYRDGKLTLDGMKAAHARGSSFLHGGKLYRPGDKLPTEAELAKGDAAAEERARENLLRQRRELDAQIASIGGGGGK